MCSCIYLVCASWSACANHAMRRLREYEICVNWRNHFSQKSDKFQRQCAGTQSPRLHKVPHKITLLLSHTMPLLTLLSRVPDGLMLSESMDSGKTDVADMEFYRNQAKQIFKTLNRKSPARMTLESGGYYFA